MSKEQVEQLDHTIKEGVENGQSIYHIVKNNPSLAISVPTVSWLINNWQLTIKRLDLPYVITYKKQKEHKQYEYKENKRINRSGRSCLDFLAFKHNHPNLFHIQMGFLGSIKSDKKSILSLTISSLHVVMLFLVESPNSAKIIVF